MTDVVKILCALLLTCGLATPLLAQDPLLDEERPAIKRYTVELVVFAYTEDVYVGTEVFPPDIITPPADEDEIAEIEVRERRRRHPDFVGMEPVLLTEEEFTMHDIVEQFELLDAYEPLLHVGWTQAGTPQTDSPQMDLALFGPPPEGLNGNFTLYLGNYLHLVVDLALDAPVAEYELIIDDEPAYSFSDSRVVAEFEPEQIEGRVRYRIAEDRIIKNGETRYFDHPKFGVVAKVIRVEEDKEEAAVQPPLVGRVTQ